MPFKKKRESIPFRCVAPGLAEEQAEPEAKPLKGNQMWLSLKSNTLPGGGESSGGSFMHQRKACSDKRGICIRKRGCISSLTGLALARWSWAFLNWIRIITNISKVERTTTFETSHPFHPKFKRFRPWVSKRRQNWCQDFSLFNRLFTPLLSSLCKM